MKKHILILLFLLSFDFTNAQNDSIKSYSFALSTNYQMALGDNYLKKGYQNSPGLGFAIQNNLKKNMFMGAFFNYYHAKVIDKNLIGDFDKSSSIYLGAYIGYRHNVLKNKYFLEHRIGYGYKAIDNKNGRLSYRISGKPIFMGSKINYNYTKSFTFFAGIDLLYFKNDVILNGPYYNFYTKSYIIEPSIGIKYNVGNYNK